MNRIFEQGGKAVNKNTAIAMSGGTNYERSRNHSEHHFKIKPILPELPQIQDEAFVANLKSKIGLRRGRLVITNWFASRVWLCRCDCGDYVTRNTQSFSGKKLLKFDACPDCENVVFLKKRAHWLRTGKDSEIEDFA